MPPSSIETISHFVDICAYRNIKCTCNKQGVAFAQCTSCDNSHNRFCQQCLHFHNRQRETRNHDVLLFCHQCSDFKSYGDIVSCDTCGDANWICLHCHLDNHACEKEHSANLVSINLIAALQSSNSKSSSATVVRAAPTASAIKSVAAFSGMSSDRRASSNAPVPVVLAANYVPTTTPTRYPLSTLVTSSTVPTINVSSASIIAPAISPAATASAGVHSDDLEKFDENHSNCGGKVRMIRLRNILEGLVLPVLVESLRWHWTDPRLFLPPENSGAYIPASNRCVYHGNYHKFDDISNECLLDHVGRYTTQCQIDMQGAITTTMKCLRQIKLGSHDDVASSLIAQVDIGVICTLLFCMESNAGVGFPTDSDVLEELRNIRNTSCHRSELDEDVYNTFVRYIRSNLPILLSRFSSCSQAKFNIDSAIDNYSSKILGKDLDEIYRQQILRESRRDRELSVMKLLGYELESNIADRSRMMVANMCPLSNVENNVKILIIPKPTSCWSLEELSYMHFLKLTDIMRLKIGMVMSFLQIMKVWIT